MIGCIVQARMNSSRYPEKIMLKIKNRPILDFVINQLNFSKKINKLIIATTTKKIDDIIVNYASKNNINFFRGSEKDVLDRYYQCAKDFKLTTIVRITSDNPLVDPEIIDMAIQKFTENNYDYISTEHPPTFPQGYAVEVFSFKALENAWKNAKKLSEREHVTPYIYTNEKKFKLYNITNKKNLSHIRCTLDRANDFLFLKEIILSIDKQPILLDDVLNIINKSPGLLDINKNYIQNEGYLKSLNEDKKSFNK